MEEGVVWLAEHRQAEGTQKKKGMTDNARKAEGLREKQRRRGREMGS